MRELHTEIIIDASPEKVWAVLTDFEKYPEWNPFIQKIEGEKSVGAQWKVEMKTKTSKHVFKPILKIWEVGSHSFEWLGSMPLGMFKGQHYFKIEPSPKGTLLLHGERFGGWLSGFILKKIGEDTKANFEAMNQALKERCESEQ